MLVKCLLMLYSGNVYFFCAICILDFMFLPQTIYLFWQNLVVSINIILDNDNFIFYIFVNLIIIILLISNYMFQLMLKGRPSSGTCVCCMLSWNIV